MMISSQINAQINAQINSLWPEKNSYIFSEQDKDFYRAEIKKLLIKNKAVLIAHYYVDAEIQKLAEETGGMIGDSLQMAKFGAESSADILLVAGVRFMGETAKILSPNKKIIMPTLKAECSLDLSCPPDLFKDFIKNNPNRTVVVYVNTSAEVKALADWCVTSSNALKIVNYLAERGEKIIFGPDKYLGSYIQKETQADMLLWQGSCVVHEEFKAESLKKLKLEYPGAGVLVHPESPAEVLELADCVGSTARLLQASKDLPHEIFIVATEAGIFYKMQQLSPHKKFISAPTGGVGATCRSCAHCPWMAQNHLKNMYEALLLNDLSDHEIFVEPAVAQKALISLTRMVEFVG